jgi:hypothetical protein
VREFTRHAIRFVWLASLSQVQRFVSAAEPKLRHHQKLLRKNYQEEPTADMMALEDELLELLLKQRLAHLKIIEGVLD